MSEPADLCERCANPLPGFGTVFLVDGQAVCRDCHDEVEPTCPNCNQRLPGRPETTSPCPLCGWAIHIVRDQDLFDSALLSKDQQEQVLEFRKKLGILRRYGITERRYLQTRARIKAQTGAEPDEPTLMRQLFFKAAKQCKTAAECAVVYAAEARYLHEQGHDYYPVLRRSHEYQLKAMKAKGVDGVTIVGPPTCAYCKKRAGVPLPLDHEKKSPELPYPDCPNKTVATEIRVDGELTQLGVSKGAFCEARYEPYEPPPKPERRPPSRLLRDKG